MTEVGNGFFTEADSVEVVTARMADCPDARLKEVMQSVIHHLHAVVKEVEPTHEEWMAAIQFLTDTGHMCTDWRQEFILLSDTLGVSMLVDAINNRKPSGATESTVLGPFHITGVPEYENGANICLDGKGEPLVITGSVTDVEGNPIEGARLDLWQANDEGFYDVQQKGIQPDNNLRGIFSSEADGSYWLRSVKPKHYSIPSDGPVGKLLMKLERHPNRPAHLHYIVGADGYEPVITHIFSPDDPYLNSDAVFGVKESLVGNYVQTDDPDRAAKLGVANPFWTIETNFVLEKAG
jgi:protocatechuate 3,4-dioxygenase beta subunit